MVAVCDVERRNGTVRRSKAATLVGVNRPHESMRIAQANGPDLLARASDVDERVVARDPIATVVADRARPSYTDGRWPRRSLCASYRVFGYGHSQMVRPTNREAGHRDKMLMAGPMMWARRRNTWEHPRDGIPTVAT